ncbi:homoserine kinase [Alloiococcus sp. CFN-8]|uniref:homoserine kinase n=1 Tax=Alloiococcus sp. CFN-8 TaxID=3416081 RepID=UPI003CECAEB2
MIEIKVPASTANLGPGFDTLGAALNLYNSFFLEESGDSLIITGCPKEFSDENNLVIKAMKYTANKYHKLLPAGIKLHIDSQVPLSRGLGSSSTCIVAGVFAAAELLKLPLTREDILIIASEIEGHPDNVAPAILGGIVTATYKDCNIYYDNIPLSKDIKFIALIPEFELSTALSRSVLPHTVERSDGIFNINRVSLLIAALATGKLENLPVACEDRLHQPYRAKLIPDYEPVVKKCWEYNASAVFLSGAGPTILVLVPQENNDFIKSINSYLITLNNKWQSSELYIDFQGTQINRK